MALPLLTISAPYVLPQPTLGTPQYLMNRAGVAITAGETVYLDSNSKWQLSISNVSVTAAAVVGISAHNAGAGQLLIVQTSGPIQLNTGGSSLALVGYTYVLSRTGGGIWEIANHAGTADKEQLGSGDWTSYVGYCIAADTLQLNILSTGIAHAA